MPINRNARQKLINAGGVIESSFSPGAFCLRVCAAIYGQDWRFDKEALPADLIHRHASILKALAASLNRFWPIFHKMSLRTYHIPWFLSSGLLP